jgi:putative transposase
VLGVSKSGFYRWLKAGGSAEDPWVPLKKAIGKIWNASGRRFGFRKVCFRLMGDPEYD